MNQRVDVAGEESDLLAVLDNLPSMLDSIEMVPFERLIVCFVAFGQSVKTFGDVPCCS